MPTTVKPSGQPIYDRFAANVPSGGNQKTNLDVEAEEIRKAWLQNPPARSK
jgi:hypothetical protein